MPTPVEPGGARPRPARYFLPRSHRLYAEFEDRAAADRAVTALSEAGFAVDDVWVFEGPAGADELDPGEARGVARLFSLWLSHNVEYLHNFGQAVREGDVLVAVPVPRVETASQMAPLLRARGGGGLTYTAHGNFVPLTPGPSPRS